jgi:hypothetical protein
MYTIELLHLSQKARIKLIDIPDLSDAIIKCTVLSQALSSCGLDHLAVVLTTYSETKQDVKLAISNGTTH